MKGVDHSWPWPWPLGDHSGVGRWLGDFRRAIDTSNSFKLLSGISQITSVSFIMIIKKNPDISWFDMGEVFCMSVLQMHLFFFHFSVCSFSVWLFHKPIASCSSPHSRPTRPWNPVSGDYCTCKWSMRAWISNYIIIKCGMKLLIHSQTSMVQPLKFGNG